jgi:hypothetical protein
MLVMSPLKGPFLQPGVVALKRSVFSSRIFFCGSSVIAGW